MFELPDPITLAEDSFTMLFTHLGGIAQFTAAIAISMMLLRGIIRAIRVNSEGEEETKRVTVKRVEQEE